MNERFITSLREWETFYLLVGSAAAVLIGLLFVAISLATDLAIAAERADLETFVTPSMLQFVLLLFVSAFCVLPIHESAILGILLLLPGIVGGVSAVGNGVNLWRQTRQRSVDREDWFWRCGLPLTICAVLLGCALALIFGAAGALAVVGGVAATLLALAIRNTWALVTWMIEHRGDRAQ